MTTRVEKIQARIAEIDEEIERLDGERRQVAAGLAEGKSAEAALQKIHKAQDGAHNRRADLEAALERARQLDEADAEAEERRQRLEYFQALGPRLEAAEKAAAEFDRAALALANAAARYEELSRCETLAGSRERAGDPWGFARTYLERFEGDRDSGGLGDLPSLAKRAAQYRLEALYFTSEQLALAGIISEGEVEPEPEHVKREREWQEREAERRREEAEAQRKPSPGPRVYDAHGRDVFSDRRAQVYRAGADEPL